MIMFYLRNNFFRIVFKNKCDQAFKNNLSEERKLLNRFMKLYLIDLIPSNNVSNYIWPSFYGLRLWFQFHFYISYFAFTIIFYRYEALNNCVFEASVHWLLLL